jgi:branched-chain amino acid transport system ATP-binding protein
MLRVTNINTFYGSIQSLFGLDVEVGSGEMVSLLGRNGMGKTTTVRSIMGLTPIRSGAVAFNGETIHTLPPYRIAQKGIGLVPEDRQVFPTLTVRENLVATRANRRSEKNPWTEKKVYELFPLLADRPRQRGHQLSGGEQQMLSIGRALMTNPTLLILDEATEGLAPKIRRQIWSSLKRLKAEGLSILIIDKNLDALLHICDRHTIIEKGRTVWQGTSRQLQADPAVRRNYLGI